MTSRPTGKRVLVVSAWAGNRGDEAMHNALLRVLTSLFCSRADPRASTAPDLHMDLIPFRDENVDVDARIGVLRHRVGESYYSPSPLLKLLLPRGGVVGRASRVAARALAMLHFLDEDFVQSYDLVLCAPQGPTISDMYAYKFKTLFPLDVARRAGVPYAILGVSMGPFQRFSLDQRATEVILRGAEAIVLREDMSLAKVREKYPRLSNLSSAIDIVFADDQWQQEAVTPEARRALESLPKDAIGACISLTPPRDPRNPFDIPGYVAQMAAFFAHVLESTQRPLVFFPHVAFDLPVLEEIREKLNGRGDVTILPKELDSDQQRKLLAALGFFISTRYHPTIFAIQAGVPFFCIKNQFKVEGMLRKLDLHDVPSCWQDDGLAQLNDGFSRCYAERAALSTRIAAAATRARDEASKYQATLSRLLARPAVSARAQS